MINSLFKFLCPVCGEPVPWRHSVCPRCYTVLSRHPAWKRKVRRHLVGVLIGLACIGLVVLNVIHHWR